MRDITSPYLKAIFNNDTQAALDHLESIRCNESRIEYERDLIIAFWFSVHLERLELSRHLLTLDVYIRQLVALAFYKEKLMPSPSISGRGSASYSGDVIPQAGESTGQKGILIMRPEGERQQLKKQVTIKVESLGGEDDRKT